MFSQQETQQDSLNFTANPFGGFEGDSDTARTALGGSSKMTSADIMTEYLLAQETRKARAKSEALAKRVYDAISETVGAVVDTVVSIVKQAVKMAVFKFAIEMCAMGVKTLVETMLRINMTPPNIDTKGVYYNISGSGTSTASPPPQASPSRYDNPFGNPFGATNGW